MNKIEKLMAESILFAIDGLSKDMRENTDISVVCEEAVAIKRLAEAYDIIKRGKEE